MESWTQTIDDLFVTTWAKRRPGATEQAFLKTPFIYWLRQKGRVENQAGYTRIEIPLNYGSNDTVRWLKKGTKVPLTEGNILTMAHEDWKYVSVTVMRWMPDDQKNRSEAQAINLVQTKLDTAERSVYEELERVVFNDGSGEDEPNGLQNLISATPNVGTVHGINVATAGNEWWRNQQKTSTGSASIYLVSDMRTCLNDVIKYSRSEIKDIAIVTDQTVFELYEDVCLDMKILSNTMMADAGFDTIQYRGRPIMWCPSAPSGNMYFINTNYIKLVVDESYFLEMTDWKSIPDQPKDRVAQIIAALNLVTDRRIVNKVLTGIAA